MTSMVTWRGNRVCNDIDSATDHNQDLSCYIPKQGFRAYTLLRLSKMSGTSSVGQASVYEAGDQRNVKDSEQNTAERFKEGQPHSHQANDSSMSRELVTDSLCDTYLV